MNETFICLSDCTVSLGEVAARWVSHVVAPVAEHGLWSWKVSVVEAHRLSHPAACGIFPGQESNPCPLFDRWALFLFFTC